MKGFKRILALTLVAFAWYNTVSAQADTLMLTPQQVKTTSTKKVIAKRQSQKDSVKKNISVKVVDRVIVDTSKASVTEKRDSAAKSVTTNTKEGIKTDTALNYLLYVVPVKNPRAAPVYQLEKWRQPAGKEGHFYLLVALALLLGVTKTVFPQYFRHLFSFVAQTSYKQKQTQEQLHTSWLPAVLINIFFTATFAGIATALISYYFFIRLDYFVMLLYIFGAIAITYLTKVFFLFFLGWATGWLAKAKTYIFIVLLVNKLLAFLLLPVLVLMLFAPQGWMPVLVSISAASLVIGFIYRYLIAFSSVRSNTSVNFFHFFLYFCSLEILPLLVVYKALYSGISN